MFFVSIKILQKVIFLATLAELPDRMNIAKRIRRERAKNFPANPKSLADLENIPPEYRRTERGDNFLQYDSYEDPTWQGGRVMIFFTDDNIRRLFSSNYWFSDGTFKVSPSIFLQVFAIMAAFIQPAVARIGAQTIGLPLVYSLLENKEEISYQKVFAVIFQRAHILQILITLPRKIMSDFELGIINAARYYVGIERVICCFFHLCQSVFRQIQAHGLQNQYNAEDRQVKTAAEMLCALAFVPLPHVDRVFADLRQQIPENFVPIYEYFEKNYVRGHIGINGRPLPPRYPPYLWNVYQAVVDGDSRTNNISEGWHNRFQQLVMKNHPNFYTFLRELLKEQKDTEVMLQQLALGQRIKKTQSAKHRRKEENIAFIVQSWPQHWGREMEYLQNIGHYIKFD